MGLVLGKGTTETKNTKSKKLVLGQTTPTLRDGEYIDENNLIVPPSPFEMPTKTPLNQSRYNVVGQNILPRYKEDNPLQAIGKDVLNYGLGTVERIFSAPQQVLMQGSRSAANAIQGKPQNFSEMTFGKDVLGAKEDNLLTTAIGTALDPATYIGGGIIDDLAKAGRFGQSAKLGTTENLLSRSTQQSKLNLPLSKQTATKGYLNAEKNATKKANIKTPDVIYSGEKAGQTTDKLDRLALPAPAKKEPFAQVKFSTMRQPLENTKPQTIEPWKMTKEEIQSSQPTYGVHKIKYNSTMKNEARSHTDYIELGDKFFDLPEANRKSVIAHEVNHNLTDDYLFTKKNFEKVIESKALGTMKENPNSKMPYFDGLFGNYKPDEAFTDSLTVFDENPNELLARYPKAFELIKKVKEEYAKPKSQQIGEGIPSAKTILTPRIQQTQFNLNNNLIDRPFTATKKELPRQPFKPIELKPNTISQPVKEVAKKGAQNVKQDGVLKSKLNKFYSATVDNTATTKRTSDQAGVMSNVARNAGGTVEHIIDKGLVNMSGQKIKGKAVREIFNMPKAQLAAFDDYMFNKLNPERIRQGKELLQHDSQTSAQIVTELEKAYPHFKRKSDEIYELLNGMLDEWGVKSGLVDTDLRSIVGDMYKHYVPGYRELKGADAISTKSRGMGPAKVINRAVGGDDPLMTLSKSIPMLINKTIKAARKNEVYGEILKAAQKGDNQYAKILDVTTGKVDRVMESKFADSIRETVKADGIEGIANLADKALEADPKLGYLLTVMDKGKPVKLQISEDLFKSLQALNGKTDDDLQAALRIFKKGITNPFKALITGYNPLFAIRNVARDIPTAYIQGTENNPLKFARNLGSAAKDMIKKSDSFKEYQALGGEGGNYFNVERGLQPKGVLEKPLKAISALNNFTETLPRYGEYLGTLKRDGSDYGTKMKALNNAQEVTVNFGRSGDVTKAIDAIVPYFNPAVQGIDKTARTFKNPAAWAKALGVITVPTAGIYALNQIVDKKGYDNLDNRTKDTYFVFPMGDGKFVKVPKTREAGVVFGALFERIARQAEGQPEAFKKFGNTIKTNFMVQNPATDNIAAPIVGLKYNKDFADRNIVPQYMLNDKRSPRLQFDEQTTEIAKSIGNQFNLSPKQIDYIMRSYGGIVASIIQPATTKGGNVVDKALVRPFTADSAYSNEAFNNYYSKLDKLKRTATDKNIKEGIPAKKVTKEEKLSNVFQSTTRSVSDIRDEITELGNTPEARMKQLELLDKIRKLTEAKDIYQANTVKAELSRMAKQFNK